MATIDNKHDRVVLRVVYDGPPLSGKTTSVLALRTLLKTPGEVFSPEAQAGRTQYFDWLDYVGGTFEGRPIACQIISVPGQPEWHARRRMLLQSADVVVFVVDARASELGMALEYFQDLQHTLQETCGAQMPPILIQANKQDLAGALDEEALQLFFPEGMRIMPASATKQTGIRDVFVFTVSLAVAHLKKYHDAGLEDAPAVETGTALYDFMREQDWGEPDEADVFLEAVLTPGEPPSLPPAEADSVPVAVAPAETENAPLPSPQLPGNWVFPNHAGHALLTALAEAGITPTRQADGSWVVKEDGWRCYSHADWCYAGEAEALRALRRQVRTHIRLSSLLPEQRLVALADNGQGQYRLWQITRVTTTLSQALQEALQQTGAEAFARGLFQCARHIRTALDAFARYAPHLPVTLESLGLEETPAYLGLLDSDAVSDAPLTRGAGWIDPLREILADPVGFALSENHFTPQAALDSLQDFEQEDPDTVAVLAELFAPYVS